MKQEHSGWWTRAIAGGALKWIGFQLAALAGPLILGVLAATAGRLIESVAWMWALTAGALTFGGASAGVHYTISVLDRYAVRGRLAFASPRVGVDITNGDLALGVNLQSLADVPIEFEIRDIRTQIDGVYAASKPFEKTTFEIPPRGTGFFSDHAVKIDRNTNDAAGKVSCGSLIATIAYGKPGARKNTLHVKTRIHLRFAELGTIELAWDELA